MNINYLDLGEYHFNGEEFDEAEGLKNEIANNLNKRVELKEDADIRKKARNKNDAR